MVKQGHLTMMFFVVYTICMVFLHVEEKKYEMVLEEKQRVEKALADAMEYTAEEFSKVIHAPLEEKQKTIETVFLKSFAVSLKLRENEEPDMIKMYLPLMILVEEDGMVFYHLQETSEQGISRLQHVWTEKTEFHFTEQTTDEIKRKTLIERLERETAKYITDHNYIAAQYGISYSFFVPKFLGDHEETLEFPIIIAVFQGWPLSASGAITYNNCMDIGVYLQKTKRFVIELPNNINNAVCYYHQISCQEYNPDSKWFLQEQLTEEEAVRQYGAVPCKLCFD